MVITKMKINQNTLQIPYARKLQISWIFKLIMNKLLKRKRWNIRMKKMWRRKRRLGRIKEGRVKKERIRSSLLKLRKLLRIWKHLLIRPIQVRIGPISRWKAHLIIHTSRFSSSQKKDPLFRRSSNQRTQIMSSTWTSQPQTSSWEHPRRIMIL